MCGISGIVAFDNCLPVNIIRDITTCQSHRGPDGAGFHIDGSIGLGHRRLAIIDLETGDQPLANENKTIWIVFNGEIYNFRELRHELLALGHAFRTNSDTEVIVHAYEQWGTGCLNHLRGMFAFAIWDANKRELFLARDRVGIKPLCYYQDDRRFVFASEIQAFRKLDGFDPSLDLQALDLYLHLQYIPAPFSIYQQVRKLPPGHYLIVSDRGEKTGPVRYWDIDFEPDQSLTEGEWVERLDAALLESVKAHLFSDVPFGAFLSGGVDSSTVVAYMGRLLRQPVKTFTIGFDERETDERVYAQQAADVLGTEHHLEIVHPDAINLLPTLVQHYGEPFADSSSICTYLVSRFARNHVKMVLSGDGGDEIFAGYSYYPKILQNFPSPVGLYGKSRRLLGNLARQGGFLSELPSPVQAWYDRSPFFGETLRGELWKPEFRHLMRQSRAWNHAQFAPVRKKALLSQCQYVDIHNYLPFDNLYKVDIASMAHGLEVRVPLLDHVFLETVAKVPLAMKVHGPSGAQPATKYIFKKVGQQFFPQGFFDRSKMGFSVPIGKWTASLGSAGLRERMLDSSSQFQDLFSTPYLQSLIDQPDSSGYDGHRIWALLFLSEWMKQFPVRIP